jgi:hypothetical protein
MQDATIPNSSMSSELTKCPQPPYNSIPRLEDEWKERNVGKLPSLDAIVSLVGHALTKDLASQDPLTIQPGSREEADYRNPPLHHWQHCGTRTAADGESEARVDLFAVELGTRKTKSNVEGRSGVTLRTIFTQRKSRIDGKPEPAPRATMSIDSFPTYTEHQISEQRWPAGNRDKPNFPNVYASSIPDSMVPAIGRKIDAGGDAELEKTLAETMVQGMDQFLKLHFEGREVTISRPWDLPRSFTYDPGTHDDSVLQAAHINNEWDAMAEEARQNQGVQDTKEYDDEYLCPEKKAERDQADSKLFGGFPSHQGHTQQEQVSKKPKKSKNGKSKRAKRAISSQTDAGPSR